MIKTKLNLQLIYTRFFFIVLTHSEYQLKVMAAAYQAVVDDPSAAPPVLITESIADALCRLEANVVSAYIKDVDDSKRSVIVEFYEKVFARAPLAGRIGKVMARAKTDAPVLKESSTEIENESENTIIRGTITAYHNGELIFNAISDKELDATFQSKIIDLMVAVRDTAVGDIVIMLLRHTLPLRQKLQNIPRTKTKGFHEPFEVLNNFVYGKTRKIVLVIVEVSAE